MDKPILIKFLFENKKSLISYEVIVKNGSIEYVHQGPKVKIDPSQLQITVTANDINILNSYQIRKRSDMEVVLEFIKEEYPTNAVIVNRSFNSMCNEWIAHNNLYKLHIARSRTKDVDLNYPQPWYLNLAYFLLSIITL